MPGLEPVKHGKGALGLAGRGQPVLETGAQPFAGASGLGCRQHCGPGPAREHCDLGREKGGEPTRPLVENVLQAEAEP